MSAFIVSTDHIDALLTWAADNALSLTLPKTGETIIVSADAATELGRALLAENVASVAFRYRDDSTGEAAAAERYVFRPFQGIPAADIAKGCDCLDYQSCEHDGWRTSFAHHVLTTLRGAAVAAAGGEGAVEASGVWTLER